MLRQTKRMRTNSSHAKVVPFFDTLWMSGAVDKKFVFVVNVG